MDDNLKELLAQKKTQLKEKQKSADIQRYKDHFMKNIEQFSQKYRYADEVETRKIEIFLSNLKFVRPGQLAIQEVCPYPHRNAYLCFLMGTDALFEIYVFGKYSDIMSDHDVWEVFSPYLLLVDEDFIHYTYINDNGEVMESQVELDEDGDAHAQVQFYWDLSKINFQPELLLREIILGDIGGWNGFVSSVYLTGPGPFLYHLYDDRGLDVLGGSQKLLLPLYHQFHDWILEYDLEKIDQMFAPAKE